MSKTISRVFDIIQQVGRSSNGITFSDLYKLSDIPKSSLHNMLQELLEEDILEYSEFFKTYYIGNTFTKISSVCLSTINLNTEVTIQTKNLSAKMGETVHAGILSGRFLTYIAKSEGTNKISSIDTIGISIPAHCTSMGKLLLSALSKEQFYRLFEKVDFEIYTEHTIHDIDALYTDICNWKEKGYAIESGELSPLASCIAAPIYQHGSIISAMSITIPKFKMTAEYIEEILPELLAVTSKISDNISAKIS